jgi:hypothetical protein
MSGMSRKTMPHACTVVLIDEYHTAKLIFWALLCIAAESNVDGIEISVSNDEGRDRENAENSEDGPKHRRMRSLRKKALHASTKLTHSLKKRGKRKVDCRVPRISIEDVRDAEEEQAVASFREILFARRLLPARHDDYHTMLRLISDAN